MSKNFVCLDFHNTVVFGDEEAKTECDDMCPYHKAMIVMYNRMPPKRKPKPESESESEPETKSA
ncbi:MAG: hypothetical protein ACTHKP_01280 [Nitrososphaeraceae archaeon]